MVNRARVLAETRRHLLRPGSLLPAALLLLPGLVLAAFEAEEGIHGFVHLTYLLMPLVMVPIAAHRAASERSSGTAQVHATTPLTQSEAFLGQTLALASALLAGLVATLPAYVVVLATAPPAAVLQLAPYFLWGTLVGLASIGAGLTLGALLPDHPLAGLSLGFLAFLAWIVLAINLKVDPTPRDGGLGALVNVLAQSNPYAWAWVADGPGPLLDHAGPLLLGGLALLATVYLVTAALVRVGLQTPAGWNASILRRPVPLFLLGGLLLTSASGLAAWTPLEASPEPDRPGQPQHRMLGEIWIKVGLFEQEILEGWEEEVPMGLQVSAAGPPNTSLTLEEVRLESAHLDFRGLADVAPRDMSLTRIVERPPPDGPFDEGPVGVSRLNAFPTMRMDRIPPAYPNVTIELVFDRGALSVPVNLESDWKLASVPTLVSTVSTGGLLAAATRWLAPRWNRW